VTKNLKASASRAPVESPDRLPMILLGRGRPSTFCSRWALDRFIAGSFDAAQESVAQVAIRGNPRRLSAADVMSKELPLFPDTFTLEEYSAEVLVPAAVASRVSDDRSWHDERSHSQLHAAGRVTHNSVQAAMIPARQILLDIARRAALKLLERLLSQTSNQMPVVSGASDGAPQNRWHRTRDSILPRDADARRTRLPCDQQ